MRSQIIEHHFRQVMSECYNPCKPSEPILDREGRYVDLARLDNGISSVYLQGIGNLSVSCRSD